MERPKPPCPEQIRQISGSFGWVDHRFKDFMPYLSQEELLLYFFLITVSDQMGCSWWSTRKITGLLKIGPATLIKARQCLEQRRLIAIRKDELSNKIIYQMLPLPIEKIGFEIPKLYGVAQQEREKAEKAPVSAEEQRLINLKHLSAIQEKLGKDV